MSTGALAQGAEMPPEFVPTYEGRPTERISKPRDIRFCPFYNGHDLRSQLQQFAGQTTESTATGSGAGGGEDSAKPDTNDDAGEPRRRERQAPEARPATQGGHKKRRKRKSEPT